MNSKYFILQLIVPFLFINCKANLELSFNYERGYYDTPFQLIIACNDPGATIKYTTNLSKPGINSGNIYSAPITINKTTILKVVAYNSNETTDLESHSYLFLDEIINDANLYTYITQNPVYATQLEDAFKALPIISLSSTNIANSSAIETEVETAVEMFFPDKSRKGFVENSGIQTWGASPTNPKKNFRLEFKAAYGSKKLNYNIFKADNYDNTTYKIQPADKFDVLLLRAASQDGLNGEFGNENLAQYVRNRVMFDVQMEMGYAVPHGRFVHVFVNGKYNGQYHLTERPDPEFFESYYGGDASEYEVYKSGEYWNGEDSIKTTIGYYANFGTTTSIANTNKYLDLNSTADYLLLMSYTGGFDWSDINNCLSGGSIAPGQMSYKFLLWDVDYSFGNGGNFHPQNGGDLNYFNAPLLEDGPVPDNLLKQLEFKYILADRMECACYNDGILSPEVLDAMYMHRVNQVQTSLIAESARWGDLGFSYVGGNNLLHIPKAKWDVNDEFMTELERVRNEYIPYRTQNLVQHYVAKGLTSDLLAVEFNQYGGLAQTGFTLKLTNNNAASDIYYTIDGSDPRDVKGKISSTAILYAGPITLPDGATTIKARIRDTNHTNTNIRKWSAMCPRTFYVNQNYTDLVINEIHYNPNDSIYTQTTPIDTVSGNNFEFIELKNTGNQTIHLKDVDFAKGIGYSFEDINIPAGGFVVLAEDGDRFIEKYGFEADGIFEGKLENSGEKIWLSDPVGNIIDSIRYNDSLPWDTIPDLGQYSLGLINSFADNYDALNWKKQVVNFTPGAENEFCTPLINNPAVANNSCVGSDDAFISTSISGGSLPYTYQWNTGESTNSINNLSSGIYTLQVNDAIGCALYQSFNIIEGPSFQIDVVTNNASANQSNDGSATVLANGGNSPYAYIWSNGGSSATINNVMAGIYQLSITDATGCKLTTSVEIKDSRCYSQIVQTNNSPIASGKLEVSNYIQSNSVVNANHQVSFKAGDFIELFNDFEIKPGGAFEALISICD